MSERDDGGPAFPTSATDSTDGGTFVIHRGGMSLRDYFAAKALAALVTALPHMQNPTDAAGNRPTEESLARQAYFFADAMIEAGAK